MSTYGFKPDLIFTVGPSLNATTIAINQDWFVVPSGQATKYRLKSFEHIQSVASSSGTLKLRVITDTSAPGAAASSTVVELVNASGSNTISTASTANTRVAATPVADVFVYPGNRIATLSGGTQTNLVGFVGVGVLEPMDQI